MNKTIKKVLGIICFCSVSLVQYLLIYEGWTSYSQKLASIASTHWQYVLFSKWVASFAGLAPVFYILLPYYLEIFRRERMKTGRQRDHSVGNEKMLEKTNPNSKHQ